MKNVKGGAWETCTCYNIQGESQGDVTCSDEMDKNQCCQVHHSETFAANCEAASLPGQNQ